MQDSHAARVISDPAMMMEKPVIRGTRITSSRFLRELAAGWPAEEILRQHPRLAAEDIRADQLFAANYLAGDEERRYRGCLPTNAAPRISSRLFAQPGMMSSGWVTRIEDSRMKKFSAAPLPTRGIDHAR